MSAEFLMPINTTREVEGLMISTRRVPSPEDRIIPTETSKHEAKHTAVARRRGTGVKEMSRIPRGNSLGHTIFDKPDAIAALAPFADGMGGVGHDRRIARYLRYDEGTAVAAARSYLSMCRPHIDALAARLDVRGVMYGDEIDEVMYRVDQGIEDAEVFAEDREGKAIQFRTEARRGQVLIPGLWTPPIGLEEKAT